MLGEASAAILQNAELLRSTLDSVSQGIAVFDENRGLAVWNDQFLTLAGLSRQNARAGEPIAALSAEAGFALDDIAQPSQRLRLASGRTLMVNRDAMRNGGMVITLRDVSDEERAAGDADRAGRPRAGAEDDVVLEGLEGVQWRAGRTLDVDAVHAEVDATGA